MKKYRHPEEQRPIVRRRIHVRRSFGRLRRPQDDGALGLLCRFFVLLFIFAPSAFALESAELDITANALQKTIGQFSTLAETQSSYDVVLRRDPLRPLVDTQGNVIFAAGLHEGLIVQGIIYSEEFKAALVDDRFYQAGEKIGPFEVLEIQQEGFLAHGPEGEVFVPLYPDIAEEPPVDELLPSEDPSDLNI